MTRLITEWIADMENTAASWDAALREHTGLGFLELAARVSENSEDTLRQAASDYRVGVVPITSGLGTIDTFSQSVAAIVRVMGFQAFVTENGDVNGIYEACGKGADILYMADDDRYISFNIRGGKVGDNDIATARGYAELLFQMAGSLKNEKVAVLGYGIIGQKMAQALVEKGANIAVYDKNQEKKELVIADGYQWLERAEDLKDYAFLADGTSEGSWLNSSMLREDVKIAAPGIPFSLDEDTAKKRKGQYIHDLLEIGTAVMLGLAI